MFEWQYKLIVTTFDDLFLSVKCVIYKSIDRIWFIESKG